MCQKRVLLPDGIDLVQAQNCQVDLTYVLEYKSQNKYKSKYVTYYSRKTQTNGPAEPIYIVEFAIFPCHKLACQVISWPIVNGGYVIYLIIYTLVNKSKMTLLFICDVWQYVLCQLLARLYACTPAHARLLKNFSLPV